MERNSTTAFILNAYPVLSETFINKEIVGLRERGIDVKAFSLFAPKTPADQNAEQVKHTCYLLPTLTHGSLIIEHLVLLLTHPMRYFTTFFYAARNRESELSILKTLVKVKTDPQSKAVRQDLLVHFILSVPLARQIQKCGARLINAQFADAAASFAMITSRLINVPYGITMHAYDIFVPQFNMSQKLENAVYIFTCTKFNKNYLVKNRPDLDGEKIKVVYHGIDVDHFVPERRAEKEIPVLLSAGRLVPKKGFMDLLQACLILKRKGIQFHCKLVGNGPQKAELSKFIFKNDLTESVEFLGSIPHEEMNEQYKHAYAFVLPCVVEKDGNRDGIPNVIAEAMAMELPVVSTNISGITELVLDKSTGYLVESHDAESVATAIEDLINNPQKAVELGRNGRKRVKDIFSSDKWLDVLSADYKDILRKI